MGTRIALIVGGDQFFIFVPEIEGFEPQYSVGRVAAFLFVLPLMVFDDDDSQIQLDKIDNYLQIDNY